MEHAVFRTVRREDVDNLRGLLDTEPRCVDALDEDGWTPIFHAVRQGSALVTQVLLEHGANPSVPDANGWTPLHLAVQKGVLEVVLALLDANADARACDKNGNSVTWRAIFSWQEDRPSTRLILAAVLDAGGDVSTPNASGVSAEDLAVLRGTSVASMLVD